jgi:hypothetical protein
VHESEEDLRVLQAMLDRSHGVAGPHLTSIITSERRPTAGWLAHQLSGMRLLVLSTATADGRPLAGPVDGIFYRGAFHFSSSADSVRARHLAVRPAVSAVHLPAEELAVTVHGRAELIDARSPEHAGFRDTVFEVYFPRYGEEFQDFFDGPEIRCWRIAPDKMFAFVMNPDAAGAPPDEANS